MKSEHKSVLKLVLICLAVGLVAFIVWEVAKAVRAAFQAGKGIRDAILGAAFAPFNGLVSAWTAVTGLFSFSPSTNAVTDADTGGINSLVTGLPITATNTLGSLLLGTTGGSSSLMDWDAWLAAQQ